jgi:PII-like signaling protein
MQGSQLTFFTQQDKRHHGQLLTEWLLAEAKRLGIGGATVLAASEGFGHGGRRHSAHFFELADQPVEVTMAVSEEASDRLFARLREEGVKVFYVKAPIEFGVTGE